MILVLQLSCPIEFLTTIFYCIVTDQLHFSILKARADLKKVNILKDMDTVDTSMFSLESQKFLLELMDKRGKIGAQALLVHLSPSTGEPVAFNVNNRKSQLAGMNTSHVLTGPKNSTVNFEFLTALKEDTYTDGSILSGDKPLHFFICGVKSNLDESVKTISDVKNADDRLQSLTMVKFVEDTSQRLSSPHLLLLGDQEICDVDVRDINELHYVLNIKPALTKTTFKLAKTFHPVVRYQWVFNKLNLLPLYDAGKLRKFIERQLEIPLFDSELGYSDDEDYIPIHKQWTMLSFFLQMCSPVTMSPIEGGHRTWEFIKYYTGAPFTDHTPQPWEPVPEEPYDTVVPDKQLQKFGLSQAQYKSFFGQRAVAKGPVDHQVAAQLQEASLQLKNHQEVGCADTNQEFFRLVMDALESAVKGWIQEKKTVPFTTKSFFQDWKGSEKIINARLKLFIPVILDIVKSKAPMNKVWNGLPDMIHNQFEGRRASRIGWTFDHLCKSMVRNSSCNVFICFAYLALTSLNTASVHSERRPFEQRDKRDIT